MIAAWQRRTRSANDPRGSTTRCSLSPATSPSWTGTSCTTSRRRRTDPADAARQPGLVVRVPRGRHPPARPISLHRPGLPRVWPVQEPHQPVGMRFKSNTAGHLTRSLARPRAAVSKQIGASVPFARSAGQMPDTALAWLPAEALLGDNSTNEPPHEHHREVLVDVAARFGRCKSCPEQVTDREDVGDGLHQ
jgi:hypothetical protein